MERSVRGARMVAMLVTVAALAASGRAAPAGAIVATVAGAAEKLEAAEMAGGEGGADCAVNRRENKEAEVPALRDRLALKGPVDHDVPVLRVLSPGGQVLAVVFSYSCH